jgi:hypothetical protein
MAATDPPPFTRSYFQFRQASSPSYCNENLPRNAYGYLLSRHTGGRLLPKKGQELDMDMREDLRKRLMAITVAVTFVCVWTGLPRLAAAGVVRVEGTAVVFKAGNNEANTLVINARGSAFNPATGQFVPGFTVSDSTAPINGGPGCQTFVGAVVCDIVQASFISLDLGDKNDVVSQQEREPGDAVPMRVKGGTGNDTLTGSPRGDDLDGQLGDDTITGGGGSDSISGGAGKDTINALDGQRDTINCGFGRDTVTADASDTKRFCN